MGRACSVSLLHPKINLLMLTIGLSHRPRLASIYSERPSESAQAQLRANSQETVILTDWRFCIGRCYYNSTPRTSLRSGTTSGRSRSSSKIRMLLFFDGDPRDSQEPPPTILGFAASEYYISFVTHCRNHVKLILDPTQLIYRSSLPTGP